MFKNKVVLVTGGSSGIGAATAELFAKEGATVAIVGRNDIKLKEVTEKCTAYGTQALAIKTDISKDEELDSVVKQIMDTFLKLDVLVNNAGILRSVDIQSDHFLDTFDEVMNVNVRGTARIMHHAVPHLIRTKGNIINICSVAGSLAVSNYSAYMTSKAALIHFTRCCAAELAKYGVRVNSVSPGPVGTSIFEGLTSALEMFKERTAMQRISNSQEIAELILYLASDMAVSITGSDYVIDNGLLLK